MTSLTLFLFMAGIFANNHDLAFSSYDPAAAADFFH
jgi:hypothetical protein